MRWYSKIFKIFKNLPHIPQAGHPFCIILLSRICVCTWTHTHTHTHTREDKAGQNTAVHMRNSLLGPWSAWFLFLEEKCNMKSCFLTLPQIKKNTQKKTCLSWLCFLSQAIYKADLEWLRGIGWMPEGSPEVLRVKNAQHIFRDSVYRTPVVKLKYTSIVDTPEVVLAKSNAENISIVSHIFVLY